MRSLVTAIVGLSLGIACLPGVRSISSSPLLNLVLTAKSKRSRTNAIDILRKSGRKALLITNYVIGAGEFQRQQMVFRVIGVWPLIHESEAREQIHAWLVARIHLSQHERRAIGTPCIITKPHNHRGEQRVSEMLPRTFSSVAMYEIW